MLRPRGAVPWMGEFKARAWDESPRRRRTRGCHSTASTHPQLRQRLADVPMAPGPSNGKPAGAPAPPDPSLHLAGCFAGCSPALRIIGYELLSEAPGALMLPPDLHKHADTDAKLLRARTKYLTLKHLLPSSRGVGGDGI